MMEHSPAHILQQLIVDLDLGQKPTTAGATWPTTISVVPTAPDQNIATFDTTGILRTRNMSNGKRSSFPGFNIRIRAREFPVAMAKALAICTKFDENVKNAVVVVESKIYRVLSIRRTSNPIFAGPEEGSSRPLVTINGLITVMEN